MQHWHYSEAALSSASPDNPGTSWNHNIHHPVQNSQPLVPILSQFNHGQTLRYSLWQINSNITIPCAPRSYEWSPSFRFPNQMLYAYLFSYLPHDFPLSTSFISLKKKKIVQEQRSWKFLLSTFFLPPVTSSVLNQNTFFITTFSNTFSLFHQLGRPSFTPIWNIWCNNSSLIKSSLENNV